MSRVWDHASTPDSAFWSTMSPRLCGGRRKTRRYFTGLVVHTLQGRSSGEGLDNDSRDPLPTLEDDTEGTGEVGPQA